MIVETTELESHLADYLRQVRTTGESIIICQGAEPVATLSPIPVSPAKNGTNFIERLLAAPVAVKEFTPLSRDEIYARK